MTVQAGAAGNNGEEILWRSELIPLPCQRSSSEASLTPTISGKVVVCHQRVMASFDWDRRM